MNRTPGYPSASYTLNCRMAHETAALERLCQVIRIRGFKVQKMAVESSNGELDIRFTLSGERAIGMLTTQLEKLHCVTEVGVQSRPEVVVTGALAEPSPS